MYCSRDCCAIPSTLADCVVQKGRLEERARIGSALRGRCFRVGRRINSPLGSSVAEVTMRNRVLWIGLSLVLLLGVVTAVVVPRYLAGCRPVPGAATFTGTSSDPAGADGIGDVNFPRWRIQGAHATS